MKKEQKRIILIDLDQRFKEKINGVISNSKETIYLENIQNKNQILQLYEKNKKDNIIAIVSTHCLIELEFLKTLKEDCENLKTIAVFDKNEDALNFKLSLFDTDSHLSKTNNQSDIKQTIDMVFEEGFYYKKLFIRQLKEKHQRTIKSKHSIFTKRELEILDLICKQKTTQEISNQLFLSPRTVEGHRNNMMIKTDSKNVAGLIVFVFQNNILASTR